MFAEIWQYYREKRQKLSPIKGLIVAGKIEEAKNELEKILASEPSAAEATLMLVELYLEHFEQHEAIIDIVKNYFTAPGKGASENLDLLLIYSDVCRDLAILPEAIALLEQEAEKKYYSTPDRNGILERLAAIRQTIRKNSQ